MQPVPRIFVSATSRDLRTARGLVAEGLRRMECLPIVQDDFPPDYKSVRDMLRTKIKDCNAVVHLAGFYYGAEPQPVFPGPDRRSFTQMEYEIAMELKLPCYVFLCGKDFPFDKHDPEPEEKQALQMAHRDRLLKRDELFYEFATPEELANRTRELQLSVEGLRGELAKERFRRRLTLAACIVLFVIGGSYFYSRMQKSDAVIAETTVQLQKQGDIIAQLLAEQKRLREEIGGTATEIIAQAELNVAKTNNQSVEDIRAGVQKALAEAKAAVAAAGQDKPKLIAALNKLIDAETAVGHENEAIVAMQQLQTLLDREVYPVEWANITHRLLLLLKLRNSGNFEPIELRKEAVQWARTSPKLGEEHPATLALMRGLSSYLPIEDGNEMRRTIARTFEKLQGPDGAETLMALRNLAASLGDQAAEEKNDALAVEAEQLFKRVIGAYTKQHGPDSIQVANMFVRQSELFTKLGKHAEAEKELENLISVIEEKKGAMESILAIPLGALVQVKLALKDIPSAIALSRRIILINEKSEGAESENFLASKSNLAVVIIESDETELLGEAEKLLREVLESRLRLVGASQPVTWLSFKNLATCLDRKGDVKGCIEIHLRRLEEMGKVLGPDDIGFASQLSRIGHEFSLEKNEDFRRAGLTLFQRSLAIRERKLPKESVEIVQDLQSIGGSHLYLKEYLQAEPIFRREIDLREKYHPKLTDSLSFAYFGLFRIMKKFNREDEAAACARKALQHSPEDKMYQEIVDGLKSAPPPSSDDSPPSLSDYADFRKDINDRIKAGKLTRTKMNLPAKPGRVHYIEGDWSGDTMESSLEWNAIDDTNGTFTTCFFNKHGVLISVFQIREGTDSPVDGVKKATDTFNFYDGKLVIWKRTQDDAEKVEDPESKGFAEKGREVLEAAEKANAGIIKAGPN